MSRRRKKSSSRRQPCGSALLIGTCVLLASFWLVVLPTLAKLPTVSRHIERLQRRNIDPSAMFYTELETSPRKYASDSIGEN